MAEIAASVLDADFSKWKQWLPELEKAGIKRIQWDVMDNRFVPNKGIDKKFFAELRPRTKAFFESHLMVLEPEKYIQLKQSLIDGKAVKGAGILPNRPDLDLIELYDPDIDALGYIGNKKWQ